MTDNHKQHFIPKFCIAAFNADGHNVYVKIRGIKKLYLKSPASQGYEEEVYTIVSDGARDTSCDRVNQTIENWCAPRLSRVNASAFPDAEQFESILFLTANLISRSRGMRDHYARQLERVQKALPKLTQVLKECPPLPETLRDFELTPLELDDVPSALDRATDLLAPLTATLGLMPIVRELTSGRSCDLLIAPDDATFITSDEPVLIRDEGRPITMRLSPGFLLRPEIEVYVPLKPKVAACGRQDLRGQYESSRVRKSRTITGSCGTTATNGCLLLGKATWKSFDIGICRE